jgi:hypothetical protein
VGALGEGRWDALWGILGMIVGILLFFRWLEKKGL